MNELTSVYNSLQQSDEVVRNNAKIIYAICRSVTPQFYKHNAEEMRVALTSIQLMISGVPENILAIMSQLAVKNYPIARSRNPHVYFDINYILEFYDEAWKKARPKEFDWFCGLVDLCEDGRTRDYRECYCRLEDLDDEWHSKPNATVWVDHLGLTKLEEIEKRIDE